MRTGILAFVFALCLGSLSAPAASLDNAHTHHTAIAVPELSDSSLSFKLARTWFLPDWQAGLGTRSDITPTNSGDRQDLTCSTYGGCSAVPANMICSESFRTGDSLCYNSCSCKSGYYRVSSSDICAGCANPCLNLDDKNPCPFGCKSTYDSCPSKCQTCYEDNCRNRTLAPDKGYGCESYFDDCSTKCETAYPDNCHNREAVDDSRFGCEKYFDDCSTKCEKAYEDNCRNYSSKPLASSCANGCAQSKTYSDCTSRCSSGCKVSCDTGYFLSADELSCTYDPCQNYTAKPLASSCSKGCALGQTADGCSSRCATGCKASCSSPKELTDDQLSCICPANYSCDGSDHTKICYNANSSGECDGKTERYINLKDPLGTKMSTSAGDIEFYSGNKNGYDSVPFTFSIYGKSYSYALYLKQFTGQEKNTPIQIVNDCQQLITALEDTKIVNIQISGHIVCSTEGISFNGKKYIFGQNRNNDKIEFEKPPVTIYKSSLKKDTIIKFSELSLSFSGGFGYILPRAPVILENVILQGTNAQIFSDGVYLFSGNNEIQIIKDGTNITQCSSGTMGGGPIIMIHPNAHVTVKRYDTSGALISSPVCRFLTFRHLVLGTIDYDNFSSSVNDNIYSIYSGGNTIESSNKVIQGYYIAGTSVDILTDNSQLQIKSIHNSSLTQFIMGNESVLASSGPQNELIIYRKKISTGTGALIKYSDYTVSFSTGFSPYITSKEYSCYIYGNCN